MADMTQATRRLEEAVTRLERVCSMLVGEDGDRRRLAALLAAARADYEALAAAAGTVATRLDGTIARLNSVVEE